eukprot:m.877615 g.877615  ORF g.877615 m.877615 type:complete len:78 (-) comp23582_c0_seq3:4556-4789(-)
MSAEYLECVLWQAVYILDHGRSDINEGDGKPHGSDEHTLIGSPQTPYEVRWKQFLERRVLGEPVPPMGALGGDAGAD